MGATDGSFEGLLHNGLSDVLVLQWRPMTVGSAGFPWEVTTLAVFVRYFIYLLQKSLATLRDVGAAARACDATLLPKRSNSLVGMAEGADVLRSEDAVAAAQEMNSGTEAM